MMGGFKKLGDTYHQVHVQFPLLLPAVVAPPPPKFQLIVWRGELPKLVFKEYAK